MKKPNITADMKVIRNGLDAFAEVLDNTVNAILDYPEEFGLPNRELTEEEHDRLSEFVADLIVNGESKVEF